MIYEMTNNKKTNPVKPLICINDCSCMAVISASRFCKSACTFLSIWRISPCNCLLSSAFRAARLSACTERQRLCACCSANKFRLSERSIVVVTVGFASSFLPKIPKKPFRFVFLGCSCTLLCTITGTCCAIFSLMVCCSSSNVTIPRICSSLSSRRWRTLSIRSTG